MPSNQRLQGICVKNPSFLKPKKQMDTKQQMHLDLGQKNVGLIHCHDCGMDYDPIVPEEKRAHSKFHKSICDGPTLLHPQKYPHFTDKDAFIVLLRHSQKRLKQKIHEILSFLNEQLGSNQSLGTELNDGDLLILYIIKTKIVGMIHAEKQCQGYFCLDNSEGTGQWRGIDPVNTVCGITRIWVDTHHRKKGIAYKLMEAIRLQFCERELKKQDICFSQPTSHGYAFACRYFGKRDFLVY